MPQYIALKTYKGKFGPMNRGMTYTLPHDYGSELARNGLARELAIERAPQNMAHEGAPNTAGEDTADRRDDGKAPPLSVSPPVRRSRKRTAPTLNLGPGATAPRKSS